MKSLPVLLLMIAGTSAAATDPEWQRCRPLGEPTARLTCYDQWADAQASTGAAKPPAPLASFGLEDRPPAHLAPADRIDSHIPGEFSGWDGKTRFTLANGQIWQVVDGTSAYWVAKDPKVSISRGVLGAFYLQVEGLSRTPKVRRLQ